MRAASAPFRIVRFAGCPLTAVPSREEWGARTSTFRPCGDFNLYRRQISNERTDKRSIMTCRLNGSDPARLTISAFHRTYAHALQPITKPIVSVGQSVPGFVKGHGFSRAAKATQPSLRGASTAPSAFLFSPSTDDIPVYRDLYRVVACGSRRRTSVAQTR
jgi:hypothetical protein